MPDEETSRAVVRRPPWLWVPSLYFSEGIPYVLVTSLSVVMYKKLGVPNNAVTFYTSALLLPWTLKPLWSPWVDAVRTKRFWIVSMQLLVAVLLTFLAASVLAPHFFAISCLLFLVVGCCSATHDIAADGFYMLGIGQHDQVWWSGFRNTFYRIAMTSGSGLLILLAGQMETATGNVPLAWSLALFSAAGVFLILAAWHLLILPRPGNDGPLRTQPGVGSDFLATFAAFFQKPGVGMALAFMLLYRLDEAQSAKAIPLFLLDPRKAGGLELSTSQVGLAYGTYGIFALICGGLAGGFLTAKFGWKSMLPWMVAAMYLPKYAFISLSLTQPKSFGLICGLITLEQFGYGLGFTAFMLYLLYFADGPRKTAHYAICTGFMTLGMMLPGLCTGWLIDKLGYPKFFVWVFFSALPGLLIVFRLKVAPDFGRK